MTVDIPTNYDTIEMNQMGSEDGQTMFLPPSASPPPTPGTLTVSGTYDPSTGTQAPNDPQGVPVQPVASVDPSKIKSELFELTDRFIILMDMVGVDPDTINVEYKHPHIIVSANRIDAIEAIKAEFGDDLLQHSKSKYYGPVNSTLKIDKNVESVSGDFENGVFKITIMYKVESSIKITINK